MMYFLQNLQMSREICDQNTNDDTAYLLCKAGHSVSNVHKTILPLLMLPQQVKVKQLLHL